MHQTDSKKVVFYSKEDLAASYHLQNGEKILRSEAKTDYTDINDVLELYNLKKYIDNSVFLTHWTQDDIANFKQKTKEYEVVVGRFFASINDNNVISEYEKVLKNYIHSFWEIVNNHSTFNRISQKKFSTILKKEPHLIHEILIHKRIVEHYNTAIKNFLLTYPQSTEVLLSIYEKKDEFTKVKRYLPENLTVEEKENILSNYLDSEYVNYNYINLIQNAKNTDNFRVSDKTRLKAKRLHESETKKIFTENDAITFRVTVSFSEEYNNIKHVSSDEDFTRNYSYNLDYIKKNSDPYSLFQNFILLFEYLDDHYRINLVSTKNKLSTLERFIGVHSQNEYRKGIEFNSMERISQIQLLAYNQVLNDLGLKLETILHQVFTSSFQEKYEFPKNARFSVPSATEYFEKVRLLAPEFESVLKQFKLFVEDGYIDFELLQISSSPTTIKDIPSLNKNKYIYLNEENKKIGSCIYLFFSDQALLTYVDPFKGKDYRTFFNLLIKEQVKFSNYEEYQKDKLNYLIEQEYIYIDHNDFIQITNLSRIVILGDLYINEVASLYHYPFELQKEVQNMEAEKIIYFDSSLFSKPEQAYFNYFLNKSEFTNGLDLRNSYLHGTQATPDEIQKHQYAYFVYLKLLILVFLKIEGDLLIWKELKDRT